MCKVTCSRCGGSGKIDCLTCFGKGYEMVYDDVEEREIPRDCEVCSHSGRVKCPDCGGTGEVTDRF